MSEQDPKIEEFESQVLDFLQITDDCDWDERSTTIVAPETCPLLPLLYTEEQRMHSIMDDCLILEPSELEEINQFISGIHQSTDITSDAQRRDQELEEAWNEFESEWLLLKAKNETEITIKP